MNVWVNPQFQQHGSDVGYEAQQDVMGNAQFHGVEGGFDIARGWRFLLFDNGILNDFHLCPSLQLLSTNAIRAEIIGNCPVNLNEWSMVSVTSDGTGTVAGMKAYYNGGVIGNSSTIDALSGNTIVGAVDTWLGDLQHFTNVDGSDPVGNHYYYKGQMEGLSVWNVALTAGNLSSLNTAGRLVDPKLTLPSQATHLIGSYFRKFNTLSDDSGHGNDGVPTQITFLIQ